MPLRIDEGNDEDDSSEVSSKLESEPTLLSKTIQLNKTPSEAIIDLKLSSTRASDEELLKKGYTQLLPDVRTAGYSIAADSGSFGRGQSMWIWRHKQGSVGGRLKSIVDIQINSLSVSSAFVLAGYVCLPVQVSGQWVWIKRAEITEELDAIVDLAVTIGLQKNPSDKIWTSPGVGWVRVEGNFGKGMLSSYDAFLWFRPARARTSEASLKSPTRDILGLKEDMRLSVLLGRAKTCLRLSVPLERMGADAIKLTANPTPQKESSAAVGAQFDFSFYFHKFNSSSTGLMAVSKFESMLIDVGLRLEKRDVHLLFHAFDVSLDGNVSRQEFWTLLALTDIEIDLVLDRIRLYLLSEVSSGDPKGGGTKLRVNSGLRQVFRMCNTSNDGILSLQDVLGLASQMDVYLTEEEGRRLMKVIDKDSDDRIEETDFIKVIGGSSDWLVNKAYRLRDAAAALRVWLTRNNRMGVSASLNASLFSAALLHQWNELRTMHEKSHGSAFKGFLTPDDILHLLFGIGTCVTPAESREIALIIAPERSGLLQQQELNVFMTSSCRSFGELIALLERDVMKPVIDCYRSYRCAILCNDDYLDLKDEYDGMVNDIAKAVNGAKVNEKDSLMDVVGVVQVKIGIENIMRGYSAPDDKLPNLEEWVCLCILAGAIVAENETYGVRIKPFLHGLCAHIVGPLHTGRAKDTVTTKQISIELQKMIRHEADLAGRHRKRDYKAVFSMFDSDGGGSLSLVEFQAMLQRLQLVDNLTESQISSLLSQFDHNHKGNIDLQDFIRFAEAPLAGDEVNDNDSDEEDRKIGLLSNNPPAAISKHMDCDWLIWTLWKECCKVSPKEPEGLVTDLEVACSDSNLGDSAGYIEIGDLWQVLSEVGIRGRITRTQFDAGIKPLLDGGDSKTSKSKSDGSTKQLLQQVDFEALCRYIVRMGRAFNEQEQKRRSVDEALYVQLKQELVLQLSADEPGSAGARSSTPGRIGNSMKFERVFKRLDSNGDGCITLEEFRLGLKHMKIKGASKNWSQQMAYRLFEDIDGDHDGLLSLVELSSFIRANGATSSSVRKSREKKHDDDDDNDDEMFASSARESITDDALFRKVSSTLQDAVVPSAKMSKGSHEHMEQVKASIRKFFARGDEEGRGVTTESRFKVFCRQSGLSTRLSLGEMKQLLHRLSRKSANKTGSEALLDYERLCNRVSVVEESFPHKKGEGVMLRLQDAAIESESDGRSFLGLCSLSDRSLTGKLTQDDFIHTAKMMGCDLTPVDMLALRDLFPHCFQSTLSSSTGSAVFSIDYKELNRLFEGFTPRDDAFPSFGQFDQSLGGLGASFNSRTSTPLPLKGGVSTPGQTLNRQLSMRFLRSPGGHSLTTPIDVRGSYVSAAKTPSSSAYEFVLQAIAEKVNRAVEDRSHDEGFRFSLLKQFSVFDRRGTGAVSTKTFQSTVSDLGVMLSATDIHAVESFFGQQGSIDYQQFCEWCASVAGEGLPTPSRRQQVNASRDRNVPLAFLHTPHVVERYMELKRSRTDPRDIFEDADVSRSGKIPSHGFAQIVREMDLLQTEYQISKCISAFSAINDSNMVCYEDFLDAVESAVESVTTIREGMIAPPRRSKSSRFDGTFSTDDSELRQSRSVNPFRMSNSGIKPPLSTSKYQDFDSEEEEFPTLKRGDASTRYAASWNSRSLGDSFSQSRGAPLTPGRSSTSKLETPRSPPGKVGSSMWGSQTPLGKKGKPPRPGDGKWVCAVCYYTENSESSSTCDVCASANHHHDKDFQVKVQCMNCTFMNGQFAITCEMCGHGFSKKK